jgi:serine phosphatase RsbU (regulator of sigma subunit)
LTINETLRATLPLGLFCSAVFLETSAEGRHLRCWNAGMPSVLLRAGSSNSVRQIASHSLPLGIVSGSEFNGSVREIPVAMGDRVVCMSDGVLETRSPQGELFGSECVVQSLSAGSAHTAFDALLASLEAFRGPTAPLDDLSLIEVTVGLARTSGAPPQLR